MWQHFHIIPTCKATSHDHGDAIPFVMRLLQDRCPTTLLKFPSRTGGSRMQKFQTMLGQKNNMAFRIQDSVQRGEIDNRVHLGSSPHY